MYFPKLDIKDKGKSIILSMLNQKGKWTRQSIKDNYYMEKKNHFSILIDNMKKKISNIIILNYFI